jgi:hypothetical protein
MKSVDPKASIRKAFMSYVRYATDVLTVPVSGNGTRGGLRVAFISPIHRLLSVVERLESSSHLRKLSSAIKGAADKNQLASNIPDLAVKNFFKRSRFYNDTYGKKNLNREDLFELFWHSLVTRKIKTTTLTLIDGVLFESKNLELDLFRIEKFTKQELDTVIDRQTRDIFYPEAKVDTEFLSQFWFILEEKISESDSETDATASIRILDTTVERIVPDRLIQLLALHHGTTKIVGPFWDRLTLPFSFEVDDDLFEAPVPTSQVPSHLKPPRPTIKSVQKVWNPRERIFERIRWSEGRGALEFNRENEFYLRDIIGRVQKVLALTSEL